MADRNLRPDDDFATQEEVERELGPVVMAAMRAIRKQESGVHIENRERAEEFNLCYKALRFILKGSGARLEAIPHDGFPSVGTITATMRSLNLRNPKLFVDACSLASNYEIYPKLDGTIVLALTFYGMAEKVGD